MSSVAVDTQSVIWHVNDPGKLTKPARIAISTAQSTPGANLFLSAISIIELIYLVEKHRFTRSFLISLLSMLDDPSNRWVVLPIDESLARSIDFIPRNIVPDLPDRIIAATAHHYQLPLVSSDRQIQQAPITVIW